MRELLLALCLALASTAPAQEIATPADAFPWDIPQQKLNRPLSAAMEY